MSAVTATGPRDAWALGIPSGGGPRCGADVEHWDGTSWRRVPVPRGLIAGRDASLTVPLPVAASSAADAWIFPNVLRSLPMSAYDYALRWNGARWRRSVFPARLSVLLAAVFGPADAWAFGGIDHADGTVRPYAVRYNGHSWRKATVPVAPLGMSARSAHDMWAVGPTPATAAKPLRRQVLLAAHWTGRRWRTITVPAIKAPKTTGSLSSGLVATVGPGDIWWAYQVTSVRSSLAGLLHWFRGRWHEIKLPAAVGGLDAMAQDGRGGVWLLAEAGTAFYNLIQYVYHYSHGRWTRQPVPSPRKYEDSLSGLAWIPGTTSVWAAGDADLNNGTGSAGVILRYRR